VPSNIEPTAAMQRRREIKARGLRKADCAVRFFFIDNTYPPVPVRNFYFKHVKDVETFLC